MKVLKVFLSALSLFFFLISFCLLFTRAKSFTILEGFLLGYYCYVINSAVSFYVFRKRLKPYVFEE